MVSDPFSVSNAGSIWSILGPMVAQLMGGGTQQATSPAPAAQDPFQAFIQSIIGQLVSPPQAQLASIPPATASAGSSPGFTQQLLQSLGWTQGANPNAYWTGPNAAAAKAGNYIPDAGTQSMLNQMPNTANLLMNPNAAQAWNTQTNAFVPNPTYQAPPQREPSQK